MKENTILKKKKFYNNLIPVVMAWLSALAMCATGAFSGQKTFLAMLSEEFSGITIGSAALLILLIVFYEKAWKDHVTKGHRSAHVVSVIFAACMLIGLSYSKLGNWNFIFGNFKQFVIAALVFVGFYNLFNITVSLLYKIMSTEGTVDFISHGFKSKIISKHSRLVFFAIIVIGWLPFLIAYLPGSVPHDGYYQINMAFGINPLHNQHPWTVTFLYGALMQMGRVISDNFGIFFLVSVLLIVQALCYAEVCDKIKHWTGAYAGLLSAAFFAVVPAFGAYAQAVIKDNIFAAFFSLYMIWCMDLYLTQKEGVRGKPIAFRIIRVILAGLLVCFTRNNGVYMIVLSLFAMIFLMRKGLKKYITISLIAIFLFYNGVQSFAYNTLNVTPTLLSEMLSIPVQQSARYLKEYPNDLTYEEIWNIYNAFPYRDLVDVYDPELSDPVKARFRADSPDKLLGYFKSWFTMFLRHPNVYFEATFNNTYGYYYMFHNCDVMGAYQFYIKDEPVATGDFDIHYIMPEGLRKFISDYSQAWRDLPGTAQLINPGFYTWLLIFLAGYILERKEAKKLLLFAGPATNILICIASPVNGLLRYALPLMACMPVMIFFTLKCELPENFTH